MSFTSFPLSQLKRGMDYSPLRSTSNYRSRSVSLPSRLHPPIPHIDENLKLNRLRMMFDRLDDLLLLPHTQQAFSQRRHKTWVEEVLEKHLSILDICAAVKDVSTQTKQDVQNLLSILRRRRDANDFAAYLTSRKKAKKAIQKSLKDLKKIKGKSTVVAFNQGHGILEIVSLLNEVEAATIGALESLLSYIVGTKMESGMIGFSFVSKLMNHKNVAPQEEETNTKAFENFDVALHSLKSQKTSKTDGVQNQLGKLELTIQDLEEGLESLFRR